MVGTRQARKNSKKQPIAKMFAADTRNHFTSLNSSCRRRNWLPLSPSSPLAGPVWDQPPYLVPAPRTLHQAPCPALLCQQPRVWKVAWDCEEPPLVTVVAWLIPVTWWPSQHWKTRRKLQRSLPPPQWHWTTKIGLVLTLRRRRRIQRAFHQLAGGWKH